MTIRSDVRQQIMDAQIEAVKEENKVAETLRGLDRQFEKRDDSGLYFSDRIWGSLFGDRISVIMKESHNPKYSIHPKFYLNY